MGLNFARNFFLLLFFVSFISSVAFAIVSPNSAKIFAVTSDGKGLSADLILSIEKGNGKSWVALDSLVGTSTQGTAKTAVQLAKNYFDKVDEYDYKFDINSNASLVEGPSAGAAMALIVIASLQSKKIPSNVSVTGTINSDGTVGAVGGVFEKAKEASRINMALFMIPAGEARQIVKLPDGVKSIDLVDYALKEWGLKVVEVQNIDEVLKYAFSDVEKIDINRTPESIQPEFTPEPINYAPQLNAMHSLTKSYIDKTEIEFKNAQRALNATLLDQQDVLDVLLATLNASEKYLAQAKLLYDQNYLYSSANYAFLSKINATTVKDVSDNPSILSMANSTVFDLKINDLKREIEETKSKLNEFIPVDFLEWHIAAKQRLSYAELNVKKLTSSKTVVIGDDGIDERMTSLNAIHDFESAVAWVEIAKDFYSISKDSQKALDPLVDNFGVLADRLIIESENKLSVLTGEEFEDAQRRLDAAKIEKDQNWFIPAAFDAVSASSLINAESDSADKSAMQLKLLLEDKINSLSLKISSSKHSFVWPQLYLDHSKYFLASTVFYIDKNQLVSASQSAKNGISLVYLAEAISGVASSAYDEFDLISTVKPVNGNGAKLKDGISIPPIFIGAVFGALLLLVLVLIFELAKASSSRKHDSLNSKILQKQKMLHEIEKAFVEKKLTEQKYGDFSKKYSVELEQLLAEKKTRSRLILEIDLLRAKYLAYEHLLRDLKIHYNECLVSEADYRKNFEFYRQQIDLIGVEITESEKKFKCGEFEKTEQVSKEKKPFSETQLSEKAVVFVPEKSGETVKEAAVEKEKFLPESAETGFEPEETPFVPLKKSAAPKRMQKPKKGKNGGKTG